MKVVEAGGQGNAFHFISHSRLAARVPGDPLPGHEGFTLMRTHVSPPRGPAPPRPPTQRPGNVSVPWRHRLADDIPSEAPTSADPLARDVVLARLEAALLAADEPLPARKLATVADLPDVATARRL